MGHSESCLLDGTGPARVSSAADSEPSQEHCAGVLIDARPAMAQLNRPVAQI